MKEKEIGKEGYEKRELKNICAKRSAITEYIHTMFENYCELGPNVFENRIEKMLRAIHCGSECECDCMYMYEWNILAITYLYIMVICTITLRADQILKPNVC